MPGSHRKGPAANPRQAKRKRLRQEKNKLKSVFVGNLSAATSEEGLRTLFEPFGEVARISMINDRETGQPRGFAFVEMADDREAANAIADLNGKEVAGRSLSVNVATPRLERSRPGGNFSGPGAR
jgi:cold-inducible RNA-binding protein